MIRRTILLSSLCLCIIVLSASTSFGAEKEPCRVIFDQAHGQRFTIDTEGPLQLTNLAGIFREAGCETLPLTKKLSREDLAETSILVSSGAFQEFTPAEIDTMVNFVLQGGSLAIMLHIPQPAVTLLARFGIFTSSSIINERQNLIEHRPPNFRVSGLAGHPLTRDLNSFSFYGGWAVMSERPEIRAIANTSSLAWIDLSGNRTLDAGDAQQSFSVILAGTFGQGKIAVFGDDAIFQNQFLDTANQQLASNLITWFTSGK